MLKQNSTISFKPTIKIFLCRKNYGWKSRLIIPLKKALSQPFAFRKSFNELILIKDELNHWDTIQFSIFYHDSIYNTSKNNNEEKSAALAVERLSQIGYPEDKITACKNQILATKSHQFSDSDTNYFTDADLSILGKSWQAYEEYYKQIRKEYSIYPDFMYNNGRKKVLQHFLNMERVFKTDYFHKKYENQARINLEKELEILDK